MSAATSMDEDIGTFLPDVPSMLEALRALARRALPDAEETISCGIPAFRVGVDIVYLAGGRHHVSLCPVPDVAGSLATEIAPYRAGRGTLRFRLDEPLPRDLIAGIVGLLVEQRRPT